MATLRLTDLPPGRTPIIQLATRAAPNTLLVPTYTGVVLSGQPTVYDFTLTGIADGDYDGMLTDPAGHYAIRIASGIATAYDYWWQADTSFSLQDIANAMLLSPEGTAEAGSVMYLLDSSTNVIISPAILLAAEAKFVGNILYFHNNEVVTVPLSLLSLYNLTDFTGLTMEFVIKNARNEELAFIQNLTSITATLLVVIPAIDYHSPEDCPLSWSLRVTNTGLVLGTGQAIQGYAPIGT